MGIPAVTASERREAQIASRVRVGAPAHQGVFAQVAPREFELAFNGPGALVTFPIPRYLREHLSEERDPKTGYPLTKFAVQLQEQGERLMAALAEACFKGPPGSPSDRIGRWDRIEYWANQPESIQARHSRDTLNASGFSVQRVEQLMTAPLLNPGPSVLSEGVVWQQHQGRPIAVPVKAAADLLLFEILRGQTVSGLYRCDDGKKVQNVTLVALAPVILPGGFDIGIRFFLHWR